MKQFDNMCEKHTRFPKNNFHVFLLVVDHAPIEERVRDSSIFPGSLSTDGEGKNMFKASGHSAHIFLQILAY